MSEEKKRDMLFEIVEKKKLIVEKAKQELPLQLTELQALLRAIQLRFQQERQRERCFQAEH